MVSRIFSVVLIFLDPLMDEFTGQGGLIVVGTKKILVGKSHSTGQQSRSLATLQFLHQTTGQNLYNHNFHKH